jgi:hypothetical protein
MQHVTATISDGDRVLLANVDARLQMTTSPDGRRGWDGYFKLPQGWHLSHYRPYSFATTDGRSGQILISEVSMGDYQATQVRFTVTGPFG